jgi:hypothetical protein
LQRTDPAITPFRVTAISALDDIRILPGHATICRGFGALVSRHLIRREQRATATAHREVFPMCTSASFAATN